MPMTPTTSKRSTVTDTSQEIAFDMTSGATYRLAALGCDLYFKVGTASSTTATAGDDSHPLADGDSIILTTSRAAGAAQRVAVIRAGSVSGAAVISLLSPGT